MIVNRYDRQLPVARQRRGGGSGRRGRTGAHGGAAGRLRDPTAGIRAAGSRAAFSIFFTGPP